MLRFVDDQNDLLTIELVERSAATPPHDVGGDLLLLVSVRVREFSARTNVWVLLDDWTSFADEMSSLEQCRLGRANLRSMSPGELELTFEASATGVKVGGSLQCLSVTRRAKLSFHAMSIQDERLSEIARRVRAIARGGVPHVREE